LSGLIAAAVSLFWALTVTLLIARAVRQYGAYDAVQPAASLKVAPSIDVIVPARNEAAGIGRCLAGLAAQDYPRDRFMVTVIDDGSTDATASLAGRAGVPVVTAGALPEGWTGKTHACWQGALRATGEWLCFIDADTVPQPALLRAAIAAVQRHDLDLLSLEPRQELVTLWERLIIPAGLCALGFAGELRRTADPGSAAAPANGQFLLIRRAAYDRAGGHRAVRSTVAEDSALTARIKRRGGRVALKSGAALIGVRMYRSLAQLWEGLGKNVTETFGGVCATATIAALGLVLAWAAVAVPAVLSAVLVLAPSPLLTAALALATCATLALFGMHVAAARYFEVPPWYGLLFPIAYSLAAALAFAGILARRRGRVAWKGRRYRTAADAGD